jgi:hypothetical protein
MKCKLSHGYVELVHSRSRSSCGGGGGGGVIAVVAAAILR